MNKQDYEMYHSIVNYVAEVPVEKHAIVINALLHGTQVKLEKLNNGKLSAEVALTAVLAMKFNKNKDFIADKLEAINSVGAFNYDSIIKELRNSSK
jgi:hypothetical protein